MGFSQCDYTENQQILTNSSNSLSLIPAYSDTIDNDEDDYCDNYNELKFKSFLMNMIWDFGFGCFVPKMSKNEGQKKSNSEHNKAWLLAESGGDLANCEPHSVHSSFRFSLCSQKEIDSLKTANLNSSTTILMMNLDNNSSDSNSKELKWRRIESLEKSISPVANSLIRFSFAEILSATRNFSEGRVLGRGALSYVFRGRVGFLRTAVAVKRLDKEDKENTKAFCRELMIASSLEHPNIGPLLGFCIDPEEGLFLVYKYVSSGSLERHLHGKKKSGKGFASLSWSARYKVAVGIAEAIAYLHNGTEKCIVHRDIKPSNILLSSKKRPKLCDFGLATWTAAPSVPFLCKTVKGTFGYLAPEYFQHGKVSDKTDVYAFGVVLLELITGRKPIESSRPSGEENLVQWAKPLMDQGDSAFDSLLDPRAKVTPKSSKLITQLVRAAAACVSGEESSRPSINEAIILLRGEGCLVKGKASLGSRRSYVPPILQRTKSEMKSHLALAMLGASELEDDDSLYGR
ncbi:probable serine/threonine-protein kinase PBL7 [Chenopodium quinoa]|uniref:Protein kinase domain-containing protein n=1 Tax=Chenopodium quinoa TaxID=63459 RepID=A0A803M455_CHEQI|nr:probable serine/threonine-protein kinase PBL7 [Chenopodium quinoa]